MTKLAMQLLNGPVCAFSQRLEMCCGPEQRSSCLVVLLATRSTCIDAAAAAAGHGHTQAGNQVGNLRRLERLVAREEVLQLRRLGCSLRHSVVCPSLSGLEPVPTQLDTAAVRDP